MTLINVFTVAPEDQQRLVDVLVDATPTPNPTPRPATPAEWAVRLRVVDGMFDFL